MWQQNLATGGVESIAYAPDGRTLYTFDSSGRITAWDLATHKHTILFQSRPARSWMPWMHLTPGGRYFVLSVDTKGYVVWDREIGRDHRCRLPRSGWGGIAFDPTAPRVWFAPRGSPGIESWDFDRNEPGPTVTGWSADCTPYRYAVGPDGSLALIGERLVLFDPATRAVTGDYPLDPEMPGVWPYFSPDGRLLVLTGSDRLQVWDLEAGGVRIPQLADALATGRLAFHPTAPLMLTQGRDHSLSLFSLETGEVLRAFDISLGNFMQCFAFAPDGLTCAAGGSNKQFVVFDVDL
jgi:WD40 repeat protein